MDLYTLASMERSVFIVSYTPFGDHLAPGVQFGALVGQDPPRSLEKTMGERYQ